MDVISQGPSSAAGKAATSTSSKPTPTAAKTTNGRNVKSAVNDAVSEDDVSDEEEMNCDKESESDNEVLHLHCVSEKTSPFSLL